MSNQINQQLLEEASEMIDLWTGTTAGKMLEDAVNRNDLDAVYNQVKELRQLAYDQRFVKEPITDEQLDVMFDEVTDTF
jgi:hypothetical protein